MPNGRSRVAAWPEFLDWLDRARSTAAVSGTAVLVEGERDRRSLRGLGIEGPVVLVHRGARLPEVARQLTVEYRRVIVLTDLDTEGGHFAHRLGELLAPGGVAVDSEFRRELASILHGEVTHVEGLLGWARRTAELEGAPLEHFLPDPAASVD